MSIARPFAYNPGSPISGITQYGDIAVGDNNIDYSTKPGGLEWFMGPDESSGYIVAIPDAASGHTSPSGISAALSFRRSPRLDSDSFVDITNSIGGGRFWNSVESKDYVNTLGFTTFTGVTFELESQALFDRMTGETITQSLKELINKTIKDYKDCGYWDLCDVIYRFNTYNAEYGLLNWKGDYCNATNINSCVHTKGIGFQGNGTSSVLNSNFSRTRVGNVLSQNNTHIYRDFYALSTAAPTVPVGDGCGNGTQGITIISNSPTNYIRYLRINSASTLSSDPLQTAVGHDFRGRDTSTEIHSFVNGVTGDTASTSTTMTSELYHIFGIAWPSVGYRHNARLRGYSLGAFVNDSMASRVSEINDYFNAHIGDRIFTDEAEALFARMTGNVPTTEMKELINNLIINLKKGGVWDLLDVLFLFGLHSIEASMLNIVNEYFGTPTLVNSPIHNPKLGFYTPSTSYMYLSNIWSKPQIKASRNDFSFGWMYYDTYTSGRPCGQGTPGASALTERENNLWGWNNTETYTDWQMSTSGTMGKNKLFGLTRTGEYVTPFIDGIFETPQFDISDSPSLSRPWDIFQQWGNTYTGDGSVMFMGRAMDETKMILLNRELKYFYKKIKNSFVHNILSNSFDWLDSDEDGLADGWKMVASFSCNFSIVTGNGFSGNAQRIFETNEINYSLIQPINVNFVVGEKYRFSGKYRSSANFTINKASGNAYCVIGASNTGDAKSFSVEFTASEIGWYLTSYGVDSWLEIDELVIDIISP